MSWLLLACWTMSFSPSARAAACVSLVSDSEAGFFWVDQESDHSRVRYELVQQL